MCGRITYLTQEELAEVVHAVEERALGNAQDGGLSGNALQPDGEPRLLEGVSRAQARPRSLVQAVVPCGNRFEVREYSWGFRPTRSTDVVFNTRIESALRETPLWIAPMREGRCILPVASFFEPHRTETSASPRTGRTIKRQYEFRDPDGAPLLLASVTDGTSLSVLTTKPNASVAPVHDRMPLILRFHEVGEWLCGDYARLADRSAVSLAATAETPAKPEGTVQLSLF